MIAAEREDAPFVEEMIEEAVEPEQEGATIEEMIVSRLDEVPMVEEIVAHEELELVEAENPSGMSDLDILRERVRARKRQIKMENEQAELHLFAKVNSDDGADEIVEEIIKPEFEKITVEESLKEEIQQEQESEDKDALEEIIVPELAEELHDDEKNLTPQLVSNNMVDYVIGTWNNQTPDIYGKTSDTERVENIELETNTEDDEKDLEEESVSNVMSDYLQGEWSNSTPDIYNKADESVIDDFEETIEPGSVIELEQEEGSTVGDVVEETTEFEDSLVIDEALQEIVDLEKETEKVEEIIEEQDVKLEEFIESEKEEWDVKTLVQQPLPDEEALDELLADVWNLEAETKELGDEFDIIDLESNN